MVWGLDRGEGGGGALARDRGGIWGVVWRIVVIGGGWKGGDFEGTETGLQLHGRRFLC